MLRSFLPFTTGARFDMTDTVDTIRGAFATSANTTEAELVEMAETFLDNDVIGFMKDRLVFKNDLDWRRKYSGRLTYKATDTPLRRIGVLLASLNRTFDRFVANDIRGSALVHLVQRVEFHLVKYREAESEMNVLNDDFIEDKKRYNERGRRQRARLLVSTAIGLAMARASLGEPEGSDIVPRIGQVVLGPDPDDKDPEKKKAREKEMQEERETLKRVVKDLSDLFGASRDGVLRLSEVCTISHVRCSD